MNNFAIKNALAQSDIDFANFKALHADLSAYAGANMTWNATNKQFDAASGGGGTGNVYPYNVKNYGAVGNGTTDDTSAIQAALAAIPSAGGVLYCPGGNYKYTGAPLLLNKPVTVLGDGGDIDYMLSGAHTPSVSTIEFDNATGTLFNVSVGGCEFISIGLNNTTTATAGAAILQSNAGLSAFTKFHHVSIVGFYIGVDIQAGAMQRFDGCLFLNQALYGVKIRNISLPDSGDLCISDCNFLGTPTSAAAIRIESAGGPKIINTKIIQYAVGIDLAATAGIATSDLLIANNSIETVTTAGIRGRLGAGAAWGNILVTANQFLAAGSTLVGIDFDGTGGSSSSFTGLVITANWGQISGGSNPFIKVANASLVVVTGNGHSGFSSTVSIGSGVTFSTGGTVPALEPALGNPGTSGFVLSSTTAGVRSWVAQSSGGVTPAALTGVNDTNVTLALGGTPTTALLQATSLTLGWTGTLAAGRLNSNVVQGVTNDSNVTGSISAQNLTLGWTGTLLAARMPALTGDVTSTAGGVATAYNNTVPIAKGGTSQTTALAARGASGLNIDSITAHNNTAYTILATDKVVVLSSALTTSITWTLPAANALNPGQQLIVADSNSLIGASGQLTISRTGSDTIQPNGATALVFTQPGESVVLASDGTSKWFILSRYPPSKKFYITSGTTYTPSAGTKWILVVCCGGGGAGGGAATSSSNISVGGGGGGGALAEVLVPCTKTSYTVAIGTGGTANSGAAGGNGGDTSFDSPATCLARGGSGGTTLAAGTTATDTSGGAGGNASTGTGTGNWYGNSGMAGMRNSATLGWSGAGGGASFFGMGGSGRMAVAGGVAGSTQATIGAGGGGGATTTTAVAGGAGQPGIIGVTEFY